MKEKDLYEECLREFVRSFQTSGIKKRNSLAVELAKHNESYAKGYAFGLNDAVTQLKNIVKEKHIQMDALGFESVDLSQIQRAVEDSVSKK